MIVFVVGEFGEGGDNLVAGRDIGLDTKEGAGMIGEKGQGDDDGCGGGGDYG